MTSTASAHPRGRWPLTRTVAGVVLVAIGILCWAGYHVVANGEAHSYTGGEPPPRYVELHAGDRYHLGYAGGKTAAERLVGSLDGLRCSATPRSGGEVSLRLTVESSGTKAVDQVATFEAPFGGAARVTCAGLSRVYVDNVSGDPSGYLLVAALVALAIGLPLLLSAGRLVWLATARGTRSARAASSA